MYGMMIVMEQYFRSVSDSCSTIFSCGPMHELCMRKHSISYCYPIVFVDDKHLWMLMNFHSDSLTHQLIDVCFYYFRFTLIFHSNTFFIDFYDWFLGIKWISTVREKVKFLFHHSSSRRKPKSTKHYRYQWYIFPMMRYRYKKILKTFMCFLGLLRS